MAQIEVCLMLVTFCWSGVELKSLLPPRFLRDVTTRFSLTIEPPLMVNAKRLLDSKSSEGSSEITTNDDSPPTTEEEDFKYKRYDDYRDDTDMDTDMDYDSNAAEENFDDTDGPVMTLPERPKRQAPEQQEGDTTSASSELSETTDMPTSLSENSEISELSSTSENSITEHETRNHDNVQDHNTASLESDQKTTKTTPFRRRIFHQPDPNDSLTPRPPPRIENFHLLGNISLMNFY